VGQLDQKVKDATADLTEPSRSDLARFWRQIRRDFARLADQIRKDIEAWRAGRPAPIDPGAPLHRHWPSLDDADAPLHGLRDRLAADDLTRKRVATAVRHVRQARRKVADIEQAGKVASALLPVGGTVAFWLSLDEWLARGLPNGALHGYLAAFGLTYGLAVLLIVAGVILGGRWHADKVLVLGLVFTAATGMAAYGSDMNGY
jgi:hypothetical protein